MEEYLSNAKCIQSNENRESFPKPDIKYAALH